MQRKLLVVLSVMILLPALLLAGTTGKIRGKVTDRETGEPLIGANVVIENTSLGASTDVNGEYLILSVPVGTYSLRASYVGYRSFTIRNIEVNADLTTEANFQLSSESVQVPTVEVVAERPLVNKSATNAVTITRSEDIQNLPVRNVENIVSLQAGVVSQGGNIYVRGGRLDEVAYYVEGVQARDPLFGGNTARVINNAIEEIQLQAGGYTAEYGGANAGMIVTALKSGTPDYHISGEFITDSWAKPGKKVLDTYSYGYNDYVLTASGPVPGAPQVRFFLAGEQLFSRMTDAYNRPLARFWVGANMPGMIDPTIKQSILSSQKITNKDSAIAYNTFDLVYPAGYLLNNATQRYNLNGDVTADLKPVTLKLSATYSTYTGRGGVLLGNVLDERRASLNTGHNVTANLKVTHLIDPSTYYDLNLNYFDNFDKTEDPDLKDNFMLYGDSVENAKYGYRLKAVGENPDPYYLYGATYNRYGAQISDYGKTRQSSIGGKVNLVHQIGKVHEIRAGGELTYYTIRRFYLTSDRARAIAKYVRDNPGASQLEIMRNSRVDNYGYDLYGNEGGTGLMAPKHPVFAAAYLQDKVEYQDLVINAGLRWDYINVDNKVPKDPTNVPFSGGLFDEGQFVKVPNRSYLSPRLGFSFPVTDRTVFHAQWGKFVQQSRLRDIYLGKIVSSDNIKGGYAIQNPVAFDLRPERTTQYEIGFSQQITDFAAFDITAFYKDIIDQTQMLFIYRSPEAIHQSYFAWANGDFATTKGLEFKVTLRRVERLQASVYYTLSDAKGTGSNSSSFFRTWWQAPTQIGTWLPAYVQPLDFNQTHRGSLALDYRFGKGDGGPILERLGLNLLFTFNSGHPFTMIYPDYGNTRIPKEQVNSSTTPWNFQIDFRLDKSFTIGPVDLNAYIWVINVLNSKNPTGVYLQTGSPYDDGYFATAQGQQFIQTYGQQYVDWYKMYLANGYGFENNSPGFRDLFGVPRQVRLGLRFAL